MLSWAIILTGWQKVSASLPTKRRENVRWWKIYQFSKKIARIEGLRKDIGHYDKCLQKFSRLKKYHLNVCVPCAHTK